MKITKSGTPPNLILKGVCRTCGCEFEASKNEAFYYHPGDVREPGEMWQFKCPEVHCGKTVTVYGKQPN